MQNVMTYNWAYGIVTVANRGSDLLPRTVQSLAAAGFDQPVLFVDGMDPEWKPPSDKLAGIVFHEPPAGHLPNWMTGLMHLYTVFPNATHYAMFEDDLLAIRNLRVYIERCGVPEDGFLNLITHPENLLVTGGVTGWHKSNQCGRGAVGLVFTRTMAGALLCEKQFLERPRYSNNYWLPAVDGMVFDAIKHLGYYEYIHCPTLLQHTGGGRSVLGHNNTIDNPNAYCGEILGWPGEDYDLIKLLPEEAQVLPETLEALTLAKLVAPSQRRPTVWHGGVIQIHVTRACDMACCGCTQGSNLGGKPVIIKPDDFEVLCHSLRDYWGVVGMFGGNPAVHPQFELLCNIMRQYIPLERCGLWCNHPRGNGAVMRTTFNPAVSNLNVHLNREAYDEFKRDWPESMPFGLDIDSHHSPPYVAMLDVVPEEQARWNLIGDCDINKYWSAMACYVPNRGLRGFFCEIAGAQAILHSSDPDWPDTGIPIDSDDLSPWWQLPMSGFAEQVRWNCHRCGVPLRRKGQLAVSGSKEEVSATHKDIYKPKVRGREVELIQIDTGPKIGRVIDYLGNGGQPNHEPTGLARTV